MALDLPHPFLNGLNVNRRQKINRVKNPLFVEDAINNAAVEMKMRIESFTESLQKIFDRGV